ncbi:MAG: hypothetical protein E7163_01140 [Firmicutes bacterium]|nr:hypothetical protein [Bacillota bacterium]
MDNIENLENWELYISVIKRINNRLLKSNFALGKETEIVLFLKDMKARLLRMVMNNSEFTNFGIISSWNEKDSVQKCGLLIEVMEINDDQELVFIVIDIDTGNICLKNDSGYPIPSAMVNGKTLISDFKVEREFEVHSIPNLVNIPLLPGEEYNYYKIFDYLRNNQKVFAEFLETTHHTR